MLKDANEGNNIYYHMIEKLPSPIILYNEDGKILNVNQSFTEITGYEKSDLRTMDNWIRQVHLNQTDEKIEKELCNIYGDHLEDEELFDITTKSGERVQWRFKLIPLEQSLENSAVFMLVGHNIEFEETLQELNKELQRSNEDLEQFAYVASHDLQEPLRVIHGFVELLEKDLKEYIDDDIRYMFNAIKNASVRMQKLIDDLLRFSRLGREQNIEKIDLNEIVDMIIDNFKSDLDFVLEHDDLPVILANQTEIIQLFQNLVSNAIKFNKNQPKIQIRYDDLDDTHYLKFEDNGIGIDPKFHDSIFTIFKRLHNKKEYAGTGLGLALVKKIVDKLQGEIWITGVKTGGSIFHIQFPKRINVDG